MEEGERGYWKNRLKSLTTMIKEWSKRDLGIQGKIVVIKTFLTSQFIYVMQSVGLPKEILTNINTILYKFLWQRKYSNRKAFEKVKRKVMNSGHKDGGLKMVDMLELQSIFNLQWIGRLYNRRTDKWCFIPFWHLSKIASPDEIFNINCNRKDFQKVELKNDFWKEVILTYIDNKTKVQLDSVQVKDVGEQNLFYNKVIQYKRNVLNFKKWRQKGLIKIKDVINTREKRLMSLAEIQDMLDQNRAITLFQYNALLNALPQIWIDWIENGDAQSETDNNYASEANLFDTKPKQIKEYLCKRNNNKPLIPHAVEFWKRKLNFQINEWVWLAPRLATKEVRLRELQWKLLHNIYPTNILLQKMGVCESLYCDNCPNTVDVIEHFFFECTIVRRFWSYIENIICSITGENIHLSVNEVLFGYNVKKTSHINLWINKILLVGKMCISKIKKTKSSSRYTMVFEQEAQLRGLL